MTDGRPTYVAICASIGVACEGLRDRWDLVGAVEIDPFRRAALADRFPGVVILDDLWTIRGGDLPASDYWVVTLPCQSFSKAKDLSRSRHGIDCPKTGTLIFALAARFCEARLAGTAPKRIFWENVEGQVGCRRGWDWKAIKKIMDAVGLRYVREVVVNAEDLGVPQRRKRLLAEWEVLAAPWLG